MRVRYTLSALRQIEKIIHYVGERNPHGSKRVSERFKAVVDLLVNHPMAGQETDRPGLRRMITSPYPYAIFYRVHGDEVVIQRIRHTSRRSM